MRSTIILGAFLLVSTFAYPQKVVEPQNGPADWSKEYQPFRIVGNVYYVGTYDLACYLITTPRGNILVNTGLAASAGTITKSIETLGFKPADTKVLLTTQAHYDHLGAMASIKKMTGARLMINEKDADVVANGGKSDFAFGGTESMFEPIKPDRLLRNNDTISLGSTVLTMLHHPGHTRGSSSYVLNVNDGGKNYRVAIVNMPTIVITKPFSEVKEYPEIANDYANTLKAFKDLQFDIWLSSHASQFGLHSKRKPGDPYNPAVFIDRKGYDAALSDLQTAYNKKIENK